MPQKKRRQRNRASRHHRTQTWLITMSVCALSIVGFVSLVRAFPAKAQKHRAVLGETTPFRCPNAWPLRRAFTMFDGTNAEYSGSLLDTLASNFEWSVETSPYNIVQLKQRNPNFYALAYNSLSDNYVSSDTGTPEHDWMMAHAADYGADPEDTYMHFWTDTEIIFGNGSTVIPGWQPDSPKPGATANTRAESRIPSNYNLARAVTNFSTPEIRAAARAYNLTVLERPITGNIYYGGIYFDNGGYFGTNIEPIVNGAYPDGGKIAESPDHAIIAGSEAYMEWSWFSGEGEFMKEFREWIATNPPELQGRPVKLVANVSNVPFIDQAKWEQVYVNFHTDDILDKEFEYNPTRDFGEHFPAAIYQKNLLAQAANIDIWEEGLLVTQSDPFNGTFTQDEALMNNLSMHWVTRAPNVLILGSNDVAPSNPSWLSRNFRAIHQVDLGPPLGEPYALTTGTDGRGYPYTVYARQFSCGLAIVRERGQWNEDFDPSTNVTVQLPGQYIPLDDDGNAFPATDQWTIRNGQGQMFLSSTVTNPPCTPEWRCTDWALCQAGTQTRTCTDMNQCGTDNGKPPESQSCEAPPGDSTPPAAVTDLSAE